MSLQEFRERYFYSKNVENEFSYYRTRIEMCSFEEACWITEELRFISRNADIDYNCSKPYAFLFAATDCFQYAVDVATRRFKDEFEKFLVNLLCKEARERQRENELDYILHGSDFYSDNLLYSFR